MYENLKAEQKKVYDAGSNAGWDDIRSDENYEDIVIDFSFGQRKCKKRINANKYELLQASRGGVENDLSPEETLSVLKEKVEKVTNADLVRINEINFLNQKIEEIEGIDCIKFDNFAELGFRIPRLQNYYMKNHNCKKSIGFDVVKLNIEASNLLGYDAAFYDFDDLKEELEINDADLVVSYHMLEHVTNPHAAIIKIFNSMKNNSFFHVEVPIEPDGPRLRYGHLFPFHQHDCYHMLLEAGFQILSFSNQTHEGGPWVERYLCRKSK